jgi:plastocyanin
MFSAMWIDRLPLPACVAFAGFGLGAAALASVGPVVQREKTFTPAALAVQAGDTVQITNDDPFVHHLFVESADFKYDSGEQRPGRVVAIRFDRAGTHVVQCAIHLKMKLKVEVSP